MAIKEHGESLGLDLDLPEDTLPKGEPIRVNEVDPEILSALKPHYTDWRFLKKSEAQGLGESSRLRFFAKDGKHWVEARDAQTASRQTEWPAFVQPLRTKRYSGQTKENANKVLKPL